MDKIIDDNIAHFDKAGAALGTAIGDGARYIGSKALSYSVLIVFGIGVFICSAITGIVKGNRQTKVNYGYLRDPSDEGDF